MESKEKISIKNFAGIEELEMDIKPINILIGPQGVGKSVVVKLIYFFRDVIDELIISDNSLSEITAKSLSIFGRVFDNSIRSVLKPFVIVYTGKKGYVLSIKGLEDGNVTLVVSDDIRRYIFEKGDAIEVFKRSELEGLSVNDFIKGEKLLQSKFIEWFEERFEEKIVNQMFVPAGRSFFSTLHKNIYSLIGRDNLTLDMFLQRFGVIYQYVGKINALYLLDSEESKEWLGFNSLIEDILGGVYSREGEDREFLIHKDNRKVELRNASSGQQEALPLLLILKGIYTKKLIKTGSTLYIEEPEAHLFPTAQKAIVELLAKTYNSNPDNTQLFITTHSPYILTSFNNLIYAGNIINQDESKREAVEKVIAKDTLLDCSQIGAYALTKDGLKDLIDQENHIINAELLDEVSNMIGREFDQLLDIEYAE